MGFDSRSFIKEKVEELQRGFPAGKVLVACSGGVDSSVCAVLAKAAFASRLSAVFLDDGLMREGEGTAVQAALSRLGVRVRIVPVADRFFAALRGVVDPEEKRIRFREIFYTVLSELIEEEGAEALVQGTIAADVLETKGGVKTQHNVLYEIGLDPKARWGLVVLEPLSALLKPQVREVARALGLPPEITGRRPFPGPGLAVRILGEVTPARAELLRRATRIVEEETADLPAFQAFPVLLSNRGTGVREGKRVLGQSIALRFVASQDALTATPLAVPWARLSGIAQRLTAELPEVTRVLYELTPKPPATIEWE